jgi:hypothetical protein
MGSVRVTGLAGHPSGTTGLFYDAKHSLMNLGNILVAFIVNACVYLLTILGVSLRADTRSRRKRAKLL